MPSGKLCQGQSFTSFLAPLSSLGWVHALVSSSILQNISVKPFFFLACPGHEALFPVHLMLWLFSITSDVSCLSSPRSPPSPALPCPWDVKAVLWIHHKPTSTPALLRWIRHLPISTVFLLHLPVVPLKHLQNLSSPLSPLRRALHHHGALKTKQNMTAA